ncbi:unnamed protein product [Sympodiomycopsis kandeliae]
MDEPMVLSNEVDPNSLVGGAIAANLNININLPADFPTATVLAAIQSHATVQPLPQDLTEQSLTTPTEQVILAVYSALASLSDKYTSETQARQALQIESESELNTADRLRSEAEQQVAEANRLKEAAEAEQKQAQAQLAESQNELASIKSELENGDKDSLQVKAVLEKEQREKREILEALDKERTEHNQKKDEIEEYIARAREARQQVNKLSSEAQELRAAEGSAKFRVQSLTQELELAKKDATWAHSELSRVNTEQAEFRSKKQNELTRLQNELDEANQALVSLRSKSQALEQAFEENTSRLSEVVREKEQLVNRLATQEESFRREVETKDRLSALLERRAEDSQRRVEQVEGAWERVLEERREQEEDLRQELQEQIAKVEEVQREKEEIQIALDRLAESQGIDTTPRSTNDFDPAASQSASSSTGAPDATPGSPFQTPRRPFANSVGLGSSIFSQPAFASPTAALASSMQRSGKTFTEVYTSLSRTEEELRRERLENKRIRDILTKVMDDMRKTAPQVRAQREDIQGLQVALEELSADFARVCEEREGAEQDSRQYRAQNTAVQRENALMVQQLADLARQVRTLTREIIIRDDPAAGANLQDDGSDFPPQSSNTDLEQEDIQSVISTQLVTFDSLTNLVAQNHRLLRIARQLGAQMEADEAKWRERNDREDNEQVREAKRVIERLESEIRSEQGKLEAIKRERDMFRTMLSNSSGSRTNGFVPALSGSENAGTSTTQNALVNQLSTLQEQFDTFREETARDTEALKDEARYARDEAGKSALASARERASREATDERFRTLQRSFELQRTEIPELNKRIQTQQENVARLEATSHSLSEDLLSSRKELERLRNEAANLRAERDLVKNAESRLMEENQSMVREKAGLNELLRNVQSMQNDLDRNAGEVRRRLEGQVEKLEEQAKEYRERLQREETARREADMRREVDTAGLQTRLDRLSTEHTSAKEQLAVAKTSVEHLTKRSEDLQKQVDAKEEKLAVYERRPGARGAAATTEASAADASAPSLSNEQALQIELAEIRADLRSAQVEAEQSKSHVEQYQSIAQASEEALAALQATYDQYKASTEASIAQKDAELSSLRERLENVATEITTIQNEASTARQALESQRAEFAAEKRSLEDAIAELGSAEERVKAQQSDVREDIQKQAQLAREAHAKYENELLAHAEDIKALASLKEELERSRVEAREAQKTSETAQVNLSTSEASWQAQRDTLVREKDAMEQRIQELGEQNKVLHQHLEKLSEQVTQIRSSGAQATGTSDSIAEAAADPDASFSAAPTEELQDVLKYLRREKEIVELQLKASKQESVRLRLNLEHANRALDETKLHLAEERAKSAQQGAGAQQHDELLEKINQLSILRESNATLRDEAEKAARRASTLEAQLSASQSEIDPLKDQLRSAQNELSAAQGQLRIVQEDNQRWQARAQSILSQYDRIDPEEIKQLEERVKTAEATLAEKVKELETSRADLVSSKEQFQRLRTQANDRLKAGREEINRLKAEVETITKQKDEATANVTTVSDASKAAGSEKDEQLTQLRAQVETLQQEKTQAQLAVTTGEERVKALEGQIADLSAQVQSNAAAAATTAGAASPAANSAPGETPSAAEKEITGSAPSSDATAAPSSTTVDEAVAKALADAQAAWETEKAALEASRTTLENREKQHHQKAREFLTGMKAAQKERDEARKEKEEIEAKLKKEVEEKAGDNAGSTETAAAGGESAAVVGDGSVEQLKKRIAELEEALEKANARIAELEASLASSNAQEGNDSSASHQEELEKLKTQHAEELKNQQTTLSQQYQKRQSMAIDVAVKKAQNAAAGAWAPSAAAAVPSEEQIEAKVQERLAAIEAKNATEKDEAIRTAVEAKVAELRAEFAANPPTTSSGDDSAPADADALKAKYDAGYQAGKSEAALRNQLMLKQRDGKIDKLQKEIAELKGQTPPTSAAPSSDGPTPPTTANGAAPGPGSTTARPPVPSQPRGGAAGLRGGRGGTAVGAQGQQSQPQQQGQAGGGAARGGRGGLTVRGGASIRGASAAIRGLGRGGARGGGPMGQGQKRKVSEDQGQAGGGAPGGNVNIAKKPKGE